MNELRPNQYKAINESITNDFSSGIHYHATGSGKSWIAMYTILKFNERYPNDNIIWICEKKSILIEQFDITNLREREFLVIHKKFQVLNFAELKVSDWYNSVNSSKFWKKPLLLIINRAFLTFDEKYKKIKLKFNLIIHDECHSIVNSTTQKFYNYILQEENPPKCIGFSATPNLEHKPYDNIITSYSIYDAFLDNVIVPPKIKWFSCDDILHYEEIAKLIKLEVDAPKIIYKKVIVWCGMIELCEQMAKLWSNYFPDYQICIDTSKKVDGYSTYEEFDRFEEKAILFCAAKHREGSDIKNLDCCVFLDKVENRCPKVFLQCIGRVLRIDKNKKKTFGLIIDVRAKSSLVICNHLNEYLNLPANIFPWSHSYKVHINDNKMIKINSLLMIKNSPEVSAHKTLLGSDTIEYLKTLFIRKVPDKNIYTERLNYELNMLYSKKLICHLIQAMEILYLTKNIPHITRGSCGSSLVCYMLGISHIDPVENNIKFARFLTEFRNNLPDIDLDFPHNLRDEVFLKIGTTWPGKVARISNHVYYHDKSALRQAIRNAGIRKFIGKYEINTELKKLSKETKKKIMQEKEALENTFRCYSLHCGGIVYYPEGVPNDLLLNTNGISRSAIQQVKMNKHDISKEQNFKIDILSSRALSQCYETNKYKPIPFEKFEYDKLTFDMLHRGDNIGIILGESPLMRKAFMKVKPTNLYGLAVCLSIIRPAATDARKSSDVCDFDNNIIFDDDAIDLIKEYLKIDDENADKYRRAFAKGDKNGIQDFKTKIQHFSKEKQKEIMQKLANLSRYGFCKAHAFSYAQLIWKLAYMKAHHPYDFWKAALNNCQSFYKKWVHLYEAKISGVDYSKQLLKVDDVSIYAKNRRKKIENYSMKEQMQKYGYWFMKNDDFFPGCFIKIEKNICTFNGIIASSRLLKSGKTKKLLLFIGVEKKKYIQVTIEELKFYNSKSIGIEGSGKIFEDDNDMVNVTNYKFY